MVIEVKTLSRTQQEKVRRSFRPLQVRILFVGESPPASGRFFYQRDSGLYRALFQAFQLSDASISEDEFLESFQARGCYLVDLCHDPVDKLTAVERREACLTGEAALAREIQTAKPERIVTMVRSIEKNVRRAALEAGWKGRFLHLPYPGRWSRLRTIFVEQLVQELQTPLR